MENPERGCYDSHQLVLQHAKKHNKKRVLVLEDDAFRLKPWTQIVHNTNKALEHLKHEHWDYLMLGYLPMRMEKTKYDDLLKVHCAYDAHAYIINVDNVNYTPWNGVAIDEKLFCNATTNIERLTKLFQK